MAPSTNPAHAQAVDEQLAELWAASSDAQRYLGWDADKLHKAVGDTRHRDPRTFRDGPWGFTLGAALAKGRELAATAPERYPNAYDPEVWAAIGARSAVAEVESHLAGIAWIEEATEVFQQAYEAERWSRFFLVQNTGGHIHSSMSCSTTFPTTQWAWLPQLSGLGEDAAVEAEGTRLCSVCFPSAPVEWTLGLPKKVNPKLCPGSGEPAVDVSYRYQTPRGTCSVCGTGVAASRQSGKARNHNKPA